MKKQLLKLFFGVIAISFSFTLSAQCPSIMCPSNITVNSDSGICGAIVNYTAPVGTDTCNVNSDTLFYTGAIVNWNVPAGVTAIKIEARGAEGSFNTSSSVQPGKGAIMIGDFTVTSGQTLKILVGQQYSSSAGNGGGGGTFVTDSANNPLIVAGGGGGSSQTVDSPDKHGQVGTTGGTGAGGGGTGGTNGNGGNIGATFASGAGGGLLTNGATGWTANTGGIAFINGGSGGTANNNAQGGFGGGGSGSSYVVGGGGGGYSGGGAGSNSAGAGVGGGGGSFNAGTNQVNTGGANSGHGQVIISWTSDSVSTTQIAGLSSGSLFPGGTTTNTFVVTSGSFSDTCSFTVYVGGGVDTSVSRNLSTFTANETGATYQWLNCDSNYMVISGATNQAYTATTNGSYAVVVSKNGCTDTSACQMINNVGINTVDFKNISIYPNPTNGLFTLDLGNNNKAVNYTITSIDGRIVEQKVNITDNKIMIDLSNENKGVYLLKLYNTKSSSVFRITKL